jgi:hypothetical protein
MNLYLDDDICGHVLTALLRKAGHDVVLPVDVSDWPANSTRFTCCTQSTAVGFHVPQLPRFRTVAQFGHRLGRFPSRNTPGAQGQQQTQGHETSDISSALSKLEQSGTSLIDHLHTLNDWR